MKNEQDVRCALRRPDRNRLGCGTLRQSGSVIGGCFGGRIGSTSPSLYAVGCAGAGVGQASAACMALFGVTVVKAAAASKVPLLTNTSRRRMPPLDLSFPDVLVMVVPPRVAPKPSAGATPARQLMVRAPPDDDVGFGSLADIRERPRDVRFIPESRHVIFGTMSAKCHKRTFASRPRTPTIISSYMAGECLVSTASFHAKFEAAQGPLAAFRCRWRNPVRRLRVHQPRRDEPVYDRSRPYR